MCDVENGNIFMTSNRNNATEGTVTSQTTVIRAVCENISMVAIQMPTILDKSKAPFYRNEWHSNSIMKWCKPRVRFAMHKTGEGYARKMEHANKINGYKVCFNKTFEFPASYFTYWARINIHHCNTTRSNDSFYRNKYNGLRRFCVLRFNYTQISMNIFL